MEKPDAGFDDSGVGLSDNGGGLLGLEVGEATAWKVAGAAVGLSGLVSGFAF